MAGQLFRDVHDPRLADLVGSLPIISEPVTAEATQPMVARGQDEPDIELLVDPIAALAAEHIHVAKSNRMRRRR